MDGEVINHADLSNPQEGAVYTYKAEVGAVEATNGTPATDPTADTPEQPESEVKRDGVFIFIAGVRIKF